ncbi:MAG: DUF433 domain-containing protein [Candidatus Eremiobacteraeota bacterium]|nr:DUF433 domain-containing protein [Candidatus Eremiobacteraeota bacterium]
MEKNELLNRIEVDPGIMVGKPIIRGTRLTVQYILGILGRGATVEEILQEYKGLSREDIMACLLFATEALDSFTYLPIYRKAL